MKNIALAILSALLISPNEISQNENENNENSYLSLVGQTDFFLHYDNTYLLNIMVHESNSAMVLYITEYPM